MRGLFIYQRENDFKQVQIIATELVRKEKIPGPFDPGKFSLDECLIWQGN